MRVLQTIGLPLAVLMLLSCVSQAPSPAQPEAPTLQIIPIPKEQDAKLSLFSKLVLNPPKGSTFGVLKFGALCIHQRDLTWEHGPQVWDEEDIRNAFNQVLQKANYPVAGSVDNLFEDLSAAQLIIAGLVKELQADICNKLTLGFGGPREVQPVADLSLKVNWQVFSRVDGKVVYEVATDGKYSGPGNFRAGVIAAFANATEKLLADRRFYELVVVPKKGNV